MLRSDGFFCRPTSRPARLRPAGRGPPTAPARALRRAPGGRGKTTTRVGRIAWFGDGGAVPASITALTFNRRAAEELGERLEAALEPLGVARAAVRVRTFHALGRE